MKPEEQISHMAQELSNVAFARYFAGPTTAELHGRLEQWVREHLAGDHMRAGIHPIVTDSLGRAFALDFLLHGYQRWVVGPALMLATEQEAVTPGLRGGGLRLRSRRRPAALADKPVWISRTRLREGWERRLLAAVNDAFVSECQAVLQVEAGASGAVTSAFLQQFRKRLDNVGDSVAEGLSPSGVVPSASAGVHGFAELSQRLRAQADRLLGQSRVPAEPSVEIRDGRSALARCGNPVSIPLRRALKWHADREQFLSAFWAPGEAIRLEATLQPWELYAAWIELRINEAVRGKAWMARWEILGRLRGDPPDQFYNWVGVPQTISAHVDGPFPPDARMVLVRADADGIRRVWVQAEWERAERIHERQAFLAWQAINLGCEELVLLTPARDERYSMSTDGSGDLVTAGKRLPIRVLPFVPDPAVVEANEATIRAIFEGRNPS